MRKMYVEVKEGCEDWEVSKAQRYKIIKDLNNKLLKFNPNIIVLADKINRKFYEENCYGQIREYREHSCIIKSENTQKNT